VQGQITINRDGHERNLSVRVSAEQTQPVARQLHHHARRHHRPGVGAAHLGLGDVARRIAHEIKTR